MNIKLTDKSYNSVVETEYGDLVERINTYSEIRTGDIYLSDDVNEFMSRLVSDKRLLKNELASKEMLVCLAKVQHINIDELIAEMNEKLELIVKLHTSLVNLVEDLQSN
ncbi:MAG: hypothetical protein WC121_10935 [Candidatus Kapaibacterium sp.]